MYKYVCKNLKSPMEGGRVVKALVLLARFRLSYNSESVVNLTCSSGLVPKNLTIF